MVEGATNAPSQERICSVCGNVSTQAVVDPRGRAVCHECVEQARRVLTARAAAKARREFEAKREKEVAAAESDNSLVMNIQTDEALAAAAHACPSCGRFMPLSKVGCRACGYGDTEGFFAPIKRTRWRLSGGRRAPRSPSRVGRQLHDLPEVAAVLVPLFAGALSLGLFALGVREAWAWECALMVTGSFLAVACGLVVMDAQSVGRGARLIAPAVAAAALWSASAVTTDEQFAAIFRLFGALGLLVQAVVAFIGVRDDLTRRSVCLLAAILGAALAREAALVLS